MAPDPPPAQAALRSGPRRGGGGMGGGMFNQPEVLARLALDPRTRPLLSDPGFKAMVGAAGAQGRDCVIA